MKGVCCAFKPSYIAQSRAISCSSRLCSRKRTRVPKFSYPSAAAFKAHIPTIRSAQPEIYEGQHQRRQWDYPLGDDQRATWKHWRWYDVFLEKWVDLTPKPGRRLFDLYIKDKRALIHEQESIQMKFALLLDRDRKKKNLVPALNMDFSTNLSYFYQYLTNTKFVHGVPYSVDSIPIESKVEEFEQFLMSMLQMEYNYNTKAKQEKSRKKQADRIISNIVHFLMGSNANHKDFVDCSLDKNSENAMFWQRGKGFHKYNMPEVPFTFQSHDTPLYQIRIRNQLNEFTPWMEEFMLTGDIPNTDLQPYVYGTKRKVYRNMIAPGFRHKGGDVVLNYHEALESEKLLELPPPIHDPCCYGHTQFISLPEKFSKEWYNSNLEHCDISEQIEEHIKGHGIMSGWTWSAAFAHYHGNWMDDDIQNPVCVQTVISDGSHFAFFCYQLNTLAIDPENMDTGLNQRRNICYGTPFMKLYDVIEGTDDIHLHRDTAALLLKFILNSSENFTVAEDAINHNQNMEVQHWDSENPHIELQKPKHVRDQKAALEVARLEEFERNKTWKDKVITWIRE